MADFNKLGPKVFPYGKSGDQAVPNGATSDLVRANSTFNETDFVNQNRSVQFLFNDDDDTYNASRENTFRAIIADGIKTSAPAAVVLQTHNARGIIAVVYVSAIVSSPSVTLTISNRPANIDDAEYEVLQSLSITDVGKYAFRIMPGITPIPNAAVADIIGDHVKFEMAHANGDSITYGVAGVMVV